MAKADAALCQGIDIRRFVGVPAIGADFADTDAATIAGFASTLQTAVRALRAIGMPPYNLMLV